MIISQNRCLPIAILVILLDKLRNGGILFLLILNYNLHHYVLKVFINFVKEVYIHFHILSKILFENS
uniref:Uncharacterized protein n=1 Tax=Nelumbo nucifera TaxID=4432 RepID=A0A822XPV1_NELNU|nr:TPA_asm: hypothetical protein HUJ06_022582 [Nelumbo nucifera]